MSRLEFSITIGWSSRVWVRISTNRRAPCNFKLSNNRWRYANEVLLLALSSSGLNVTFNWSFSNSSRRSSLGMAALSPKGAPYSGLEKLVVWNRSCRNYSARPRRRNLVEKKSLIRSFVSWALISQPRVLILLSATDKARIERLYNTWTANSSQAKRVGTVQTALWNQSTV